MSGKVTQCVCFGYSFARLKLLSAEQNFLCVEEVKRGTGCGSACGLCAPYIKKMLETGKTEFDIIRKVK